MNRWPLVFFAVNFAGSILYAVAAVLLIGQGLAGDQTPAAFLSAACLVIPVTVFAIGEWLLYMRRVHKLAHPLGAVCGCVGLLVLLSFAGNCYEAITESSPTDPLFWTAFGVLSFVIAGYLLWCCWFRLRRQW